MNYQASNTAGKTPAQKPAPAPKKDGGGTNPLNK